MIGMPASVRPKITVGRPGHPGIDVTIPFPWDLPGRHRLNSPQHLVHFIDVRSTAPNECALTLSSQGPSDVEYTSNQYEVWTAAMAIRGTCVRRAKSGLAKWLGKSKSGGVLDLLAIFVLKEDSCRRSSPTGTDYVIASRWPEF